MEPRVGYPAGAKKLGAVQVAAEAKPDSLRARANDKHPRDPAQADKEARDDDGPIGTALRSAYRRTVDEDIPPEMIELLGKLR